MSETVHYKGILQIVMFGNSLDYSNDIEAKCKYFMNEYGCYELESYFDSWQEYFIDEYYKYYIIHDNDIYEVVYVNDIAGQDDFNIYRNSNGVYNFDVKYYNGDCDFNEAIDKAFENMNKKQP